MEVGFTTISSDKINCQHITKIATFNDVLPFFKRTTSQKQTYIGQKLIKDQRQKQENPAQEVSRIYH